jgi:hypothetical protein
MLSDKLASKHHLILTPTKASVIHKLFLQLIGKLHVILHQLYTYRNWNFILKLQDCNHDILHMGEYPWKVFHKGDVEWFWSEIQLLICGAQEFHVNCISCVWVGTLSLFLETWRDRAYFIFFVAHYLLDHYIKLTKLWIWRCQQH